MVKRNPSGLLADDAHYWLGQDQFTCFCSEPSVAMPRDKHPLICGPNLV